MKRGISSKRTSKKKTHKDEIDAAIAEGLKDIAVAEFHAHLHKQVVQK